jgi:hypothetical protein
MDIISHHKALMEYHPNKSNINKLNKDMAARSTRARASNHNMDNPYIPINNPMAEDLLVINLAHSIWFWSVTNSSVW